MKLIKEINLLTNKKLIIWLNFATIPLVFLFLVLFTLLADRVVSLSYGSPSLPETIFYLVVFIILIFIHEGIHGIFFKVFNPKGKVKFGFKNGMAYATSPHSLYSKGKFAWIGLAPFVVITTILFILLALKVLPAFYFVLLAAIHGSCCVGDFYWMWLLIRAPKGILVEDTEQGINLYEKMTEEE